MTMDMTRPAGVRLSKPRFGDAETFKQLPARRPIAPPASTDVVRWTLIDLDRYEVRKGEQTLGFIDVVGAIFVVLAGPRYSRAVEIAQTLIFEEAVDRLPGR